MFQFRASVADGGPVLNQYCVFGMDSLYLSNATIKKTSCHSFQAQNIESMLF